MSRLACAFVLAVVGLSAGTKILDERLASLAAKVEGADDIAELEAKLAAAKAAKAAKKEAKEDSKSDAVFSDEAWENVSTKAKDGVASEPAAKEATLDPAVPEAEAQVSLTATNKVISNFDELVHTLSSLPEPSATEEQVCSGNMPPELGQCFSGVVPLGVGANGEPAGEIRMNLKFNSDTKIHVSATGNALGRDINIHNLGKDISWWWNKQTHIHEEDLKKAMPFRYAYCADQEVLQVSADVSAYKTKALLPKGECPS